MFYSPMGEEPLIAQRDPLRIERAQMNLLSIIGYRATSRSCLLILRLFSVTFINLPLLLTLNVKLNFIISYCSAWLLFFIFTMRLLDFLCLFLVVPALKVQGCFRKPWTNIIIVSSITPS